MNFYTYHLIFEIIALVAGVFIYSTSRVLHKTVLAFRGTDRMDLFYIQIYGFVLFITTALHTVCMYSLPDSPGMLYIGNVANAIRHVMIPTALVLIFERPSRVSIRTFVIVCSTLVTAIFLSQMNIQHIMTGASPYVYVIYALYTLLCLVHIRVRITRANRNGGINGPKLTASVASATGLMFLYTLMCIMCSNLREPAMVIAHVVAVMSIFPVLRYILEGESHG